MLGRRCEEVLGGLEGGYCVTYASGSAALMAALSHYRPRRIVSSIGYMGSKRCVDLYRKQCGVGAGDIELLPLDEALRDGLFIAGDLVIVESPSNPTCMVYDLPLIGERVHAASAHLLVDSTFASPVSIRPLACGADMVMHSSTKFIGGHSDLLAGALCTDRCTAMRLKSERLYLGSPMGSFESFLLLRSLRTLHLRYARQARNAVRLARWLYAQPCVRAVWHPCLPSHPSHAVAARLLDHLPPCFAFEMASEADALGLLHGLRLLHVVTSLGGVETTIDWRYRHDSTQPRGLLRISVGIEHYRDLIHDLALAMRALGHDVVDGAGGAKKVRVHRSKVRDPKTAAASSDENLATEKTPRTTQVDVPVVEESVDEREQAERKQPKHEE
jgi:cystathionine gamma-synthase